MMKLNKEIDERSSLTIEFLTWHESYAHIQAKEILYQSTLSATAPVSAKTEPQVIHSLEVFSF